MTEAKFSHLNKAYSDVHEAGGHDRPVSPEGIQIAETKIQAYMDFFRRQFPNTSIIPKQHFLENYVTAWLETWGFWMTLHGKQGGQQIHAVNNRMRSTAWGIRTDSDRLRNLMTQHLLLVTPDLSVPMPSRKH